MWYEDPDDGHPVCQKPTISTPNVHRIIIILSTSRDRIVFLELATVSQHFAILVQETTDSISTGGTGAVCASLDSRMAVLWSERANNKRMEFWEFHDEHPG